MFVVNSSSNSVSVVNPDTNAVVATVAVGAEPKHAVVNAAGTRAYVTNEISNTVSVLDITVSPPVVLTSFGSIAGAYAIAISPDDSRVYVTSRRLSGRLDIWDVNSFTPVAPVPVGGEPKGVAISPDGSLAYVSNEFDSTISVVNTSTFQVVGTITGLNSPLGLVITPNGQRLYVANFGTDNVAIVNLSGNSGTVAGTIPVGVRPVDMAINPAGTIVYAMNGGGGSNSVSVIQTSTDTVIQTITGLTQPYGAVFTPDGSSVYVANHGSNNVSVVNAATHAVVGSPIAVGGSPFSAAMGRPVTATPTLTPTITPTPTNTPISSPTPTPTRTPTPTITPTRGPCTLCVYATNMASNTVSAIDTTDNVVVANFGEIFGPYGVAVNPAGTRAYVTNYAASALSVVNLTTAPPTVLHSVGVGSFPRAVVVNLAGTRAYVLNEGSQNVTVLDVTTSPPTLVTTVTLTGFTYGSLAIHPDGSRVYVTDENPTKNLVEIIDTSSNTEIGTISGFVRPRGIAVSPSGTRAYVANRGDCCSYTTNAGLAVVDTTTNVVLTTIALPAGAEPHSVAVNPAGTRVYVSNAGNNTVSVINTSNNTIVATITGITAPEGVTVHPDGTYVYVVSFGSPGTVKIVDASNNTVVGTATVQNQPRNVGIKPPPTWTPTPTPTLIARAPRRDLSVTESTAGLLGASLNGTLPRRT